MRFNVGSDLNVRENYYTTNQNVFDTTLNAILVGIGSPNSNFLLINLHGVGGGPCAKLKDFSRNSKCKSDDL